MAGRAYQPPNSYSDNLARKKRRRFFIRLSALLLCGIILFGFSAYAVFYSGWLEINDVSIGGLKSVTEDQVSLTIKNEFEKNALAFLRIKLQKNAIFFNSDLVKEEILAQFPIIRNVEITRELPHKIIVTITERVALGTWCLDSGCYYFDEDGVLWGKALRSSGSLLLSVDDLRPVTKGNGDTQNTTSVEGSKINTKFLLGIKEAAGGLENIGIKINRVEIPADSIGEFRVFTTRGYYLILDAESNIKERINVLGILLKEKGSDFHPQYIDLKVEGRAYFK